MYPPPNGNQVSPASSIISAGTGYAAAGNLPGLDITTADTEASVSIPLLDRPFHPYQQSMPHFAAYTCYRG
ncbi:hypothetical protein BT69DRAFT_1276897 [Atractiella rhizophila]|nr:hypothetical protein BT69DRAFT_1276897 [Atractiella rhizophila]